MRNHPIYSRAEFAKTLLRVMVVGVLMFASVMIFTYYKSEEMTGGPFQMDLSFAIPALIYVTFIFGWAIAYNKFFEFPASQRMLLLGTAIAGLIMPVLGTIAVMASGQKSFQEVLGIVPGFLLGTFVGAAVQLYFMVIVLRYIIRVRWPF